MSVALPEAEILPVDEIIPYWRNPRKIPQVAVDAVAESIERYGYHQPIVVDSDKVIIVGHTRHAALKQLGITEVQVYVTDLPEAKAREYRLVDNRTSEMSVWDRDALMSELQGWEQDLINSFFPEIDLEVKAIQATDVTADDVEKATKKALAVKTPDPLLTTEVVCPSCFHTFQVRTDSLPGLSGADLDTLQAG